MILFTSRIKATIKNIGDGTAYAPFTIKVEVYRYLYGIIPILYNTTRIRINDDIQPGKECYPIIAEHDGYSSGIYKILVTANPGGFINESCYDNNHLSHRFMKIIFLTRWLLF